LKSGTQQHLVVEGDRYGIEQIQRILIGPFHEYAGRSKESLRRHVSLPVIGSDVHHVDKGTPMKAAPPSRNRFLVRREAAREAVRRYILADAEVLPNTSGKVRLGKVPQHLLVEHLGSGGIAQGALYLREGVVGPLRDGLVGGLVAHEPIPGRRGVRAVHGQEKHV